MFVPTSAIPTTTSSAANMVTTSTGPDEHIADLRDHINDIDTQLVDLWRQRAALSKEIGTTRVAAGGTRLVLSREREILQHFSTELGEDGTQLALLLLRAGRGKL
ncbi:MAG: chorismate mutase [Longispora sp.]|nr:chorismate mutase [Longispora sp. (in: high G+C Gram-positive bacteria)]